ncbi:MAG: PmbA/TldA family metallopeptidase, partial [Gemmatimonadales bacterium]
MKQDDRHGLSESAARVLAHRVLDSSQADHARVNIASGRRAFIRSADNRITTAGASDNTTVTITSVFGRRIASVTTNALDRDGLADAVRRSEALARLAPENPEYLPELGEQHYADVEAYYDSTGDLSPELLAEVQAMA